ncbi:MAG: AAA family ATPase [Gammaproteobacteria bacterium]|nr:AAA family ATPase [Gammaproteobacteria bacterium]
MKKMRSRGRLRCRSGYALWPALEARVRLWLLRGLLETERWRRLCVDDEDEEDEEADAFHLRELFGVGTLAPTASPRALASALRGALKAAEAVRPDALPGVEALGTEIALTEIEQDLLLFAALAKARGLFQRGLGLLGRVVGGRADVMALIASCLGVTAEEVTAALARGSTLTSMGLVTLETTGYGRDLDDWLDTTPDLLARLLEPNLSAATLLASYLKSGSEAPRDLADFNHLAGVIALARPLLARAADGLRGVNILLYGPPGTGKTALARALAADIGVRLLEVAVAGTRGEALESPERARALRLVTHLGAQGGRAIVLFDEVEDYFRADNLFPGVTTHPFRHQRYEALDNIDI